MSHDFIIVGGGSAGCVLANRLSQDKNNKVLVLEAGRPDSLWDVFIHMPAALTIPIGNKRYDWCYQSEPEPYMNNRRIFHARGKLLGGCSSINGMIFQRGNPLDYERWGADAGMDSWNYAHCLPYFKKMEECLQGEDSYRGGSGPLTLERGPAKSPLFAAFLKATEQAGYFQTDDVNGYRQEGFATFDRNIHNGRRLSAARAYLHPVMSRPNLEVKTRVLTSRILFEGTKAVGVEYKHRNRTTKSYGAHIILCAGAFNTPQLLQLSGIGSAAHLESLGIKTVVDLPGVGENLQDHLEVYVQYMSKKPVSMNPALKWRNKPWIGMQWLFAKSGPASTNHFEAGGFMRSNEQVKYPNLMFHFLPLAVRYDGTAPEGGHGYQVHVGPMYSNSRGTVKISSTDPTVYPKLQFNYLSTPEDRSEWVQAIGCARNILNQPAFDEFNGGEISPGTEIESEKDILDWVARDAETAIHPCGTAKMGTGSEAVVDPLTMNVHGTSNLSVVDASVMPYVTNGNIYAPVMMLAEKSCDLILGQSPLESLELPFYRHEGVSAH